MRKEGKKRKVFYISMLPNISLVEVTMNLE